MYWTLFLTFVKIGMFTIGGGYAMLPLIQRDVVDRGWMTKEDFEEDMGRFCLCLGHDSPFFCNHALDRVILYAGKG